MTSSFLLLNFLPRYMYSPHLIHCKENGIIMRTSTCLYGSYFLLGTSKGSKSGGKYLLSTFRSPMVYGVAAAARGSAALRRALRRGGVRLSAE